jgi:hypothetical protein
VIPPTPKTLDLPDGTVGYFVRHPRRDDCLAAALATTLQVPIDEVPDPRLNERARAGEDLDAVSRSAWAQLERWLAARRLRMVTHRKVPAARGRWIGVVPLRGWADHCMVMSRAEVLFDPVRDFPLVALAKLLPAAEVERSKICVRRWGPEHVSWGLSFQNLTRKAR